MHTAISRNVVGENVHATTPKGNMGYDQYTVPGFCLVLGAGLILQDYMVFLHCYLA